MTANALGAERGKHKFFAQAEIGKSVLYACSTANLGGETYWLGVAARFIR